MAAIQKRNNTWRVQIRRAGYPDQYDTFDSRAEAEAFARRVESDMDRGIFADRAEAERNTLGDLLKRYAEEVSPHKKGGDGEILRIRKLRKDAIAGYKITALNGPVIANFRDRRLRGDHLNKAVSGSTVNRDLNLISHVLNVATREWGIHLDVNPVSKIRRPRENRARSRRLSPVEEVRLLAELELTQRDERGRYQAGGTHNAWVLPAVIIALETGMRRSEILALTWPDVFLDDRYVRLHDTKNGEARDVPLSTRALATLQDLPRHESGRVFPITGEALKRAFVRACERAEIENLHYHDLRHEAVSRLAERLDNILELSAVTGHKTVQMLRRYYHPRAKDLALKLG